MRGIRLTLVISLCALVGGAGYLPVAASSTLSGECQNEEAEIRAVPQGVVDAWADADAAGIAAQFTEDADFISGDGTYVNGSADLEQYYAINFLGFLNGTQVTAEPNKIVCETPNVARIITLGGVLFPGDVEVRPEWRGIQSWVVVRRGGDWLASSFHNTRTLLTELPG